MLWMKRNGLPVDWVVLYPRDENKTFFFRPDTEYAAVKLKVVVRAQHDHIAGSVRSVVGFP